MKSLLYDSNCAKLGYIKEKTFEKLSLEKMLDFFIPERYLKKIFISVLSRPMLSEKSIKYRQEILKEFAKNPAVFSNLSDLFDRFKVLKDNFNSERRENLRFFKGSGSELSLQGTKAVLRSCSVKLKEELSLISSMYNCVLPYEFTSEGLRIFKNELFELCSGGGIELLSEICSYFESRTESAPISVNAEIDQSGKIALFALVKDSVRKEKNTLKKRSLLNFFSRKNEDSGEKNITLPDVTSTAYNALETNSLSVISEKLDGIFRALSEIFEGYARDFDFYKGALMYMDFLKRKGCPAVFPSVSEENSDDIKELYDLLLVSEIAETQNVVPNNFSRGNDEKGFLIFGDNGCGKTVYIRSVAAAYIFAEAGLPIPAASAKMRCYHSIEVLFAKSEEEDKEKGAGVGRFEGEVIEMHELINTLENGTLVFFNEMFQSTDYNEGAEALCSILDYLTERGAVWITVSHLKKLSSLEDGAKVLYADSGFRIAPCG